jgi:hypothetical protein
MEIGGAKKGQKPTITVVRQTAGIYAVLISMHAYAR